MAIYTIQFQIQSNVPVEELGYQLEVYKDLMDVPHYALPKTPITPLAAGYKTQLHKTIDIDPTKDQNFILALMLYRKVNNNYQAVFNKPKTKVYSLVNPPTLSDKKEQNISYFETKDNTKPDNNKEVNITVLKVTARKRAFEDQKYKEGTPQDPFSKSKIEQQILNRLVGYDYPNQRGT